MSYSSINTIDHLSLSESAYQAFLFSSDEMIDCLLSVVLFERLNNIF